jgi:hypothetical protein
VREVARALSVCVRAVAGLMDAQWRYASFYLSAQTERVMFEAVASPSSTAPGGGDVIALDDIAVVTSCLVEGSWAYSRLG